MTGLKQKQKIGLITAVFLLFTLTACDNSEPIPTLMPAAALPTADMESLLATQTPLPTLFPTTTPQATPTWPQTEPANTNLVTEGEQTPIPNTQPPPTATADLRFGLPVNEIPPNVIVRMSPDVEAHVYAIFQRGQELGRDPRRFSKVGDSAVLTSHYLTRFDDVTYYNLGQYDYLQPVIDHYAGSFKRYGAATKVGLSSFGVLDPLWANKEWCTYNEHMLACELRHNNPSVLLMRIGTNDNLTGKLFKENMRQIIEYSIEEGVIPVLASKADRFEGDNRNNEVLYELADEYKIPLWDFDAVAATLPSRGLTPDNAHLTISDTNDYTDPNIFTKGYPMNDLTALIALEAILYAIEKGAE